MSTNEHDLHVVRALLDGPRDIIILALDRNFRYLSFNDAHRRVALATWGKEPEIGADMTDFFREGPERDDARSNYQRAIDGEHYTSSFSYGEGAHQHCYESSFGPLYGKDGKTIIGATCFVLDVTARNKAAEELKETHARLEALIAEKSAALSKSQELEESLEKKNDELRGQVAENGELVERLRLAIDELSTPVLEVWDEVLALPVVGIVDSQRSVQMEERMLAAITQHKSRFVILDLTGVGTMDTGTADRFIKLARSAELLGAECIVTGIQPAVAQTLVTLGVEFATLTTARNLKQGLEICLARQSRGLSDARNARRIKSLT